MSSDETRREELEARGSPWVAAASRATALGLGLFTLANLTIGLHSPDFDANVWWIDTRPLPAWLANLLLIVSATALVMQGAMRSPPRLHRRIVLIVLTLIAAAGSYNTVVFYRLVAEAEIHSRFPVPFSVVVVATAIALGSTLGRSSAKLAWRHRIGGAIVLAALAAAFPLAQMACFGTTDYRRPGDVVVVFGAGVAPDGTPSLALEDRVLTACELFRGGLVERILVSGGPGRGRVHEVDAMKKLAVERGGVPASAVIADPLGVDTRSTVRNVCRIANERGFRSLLAVSHFYHLPRIKTAFQRAGFEVFTVPARESRPLVRMPFYIAREVLAYWWYYFTV